MTTSKRGLAWMIGLVLADTGLITREQLDQAWKSKTDNHSSLLDTPGFCDIISQETLATVIGFQLGLPVLGVQEPWVYTGVMQPFTEQYAREHHVVRVTNDADGSMRIATRMPDFGVLAWVSSRVIVGCQVNYVLVTGDTLEKLIDQAYAPVGPTP